MATISELKLKVRVEGGQLKVLSAELGKVSKSAKDAGGQGNAAFAGMNSGALSFLRTAGKVTAILGLISVGISALGLGILTKQFIAAGDAAQTAETRIGSIFQTSKEEARQAFQAIREFAAPLPATTNEIVDAFVALSAINVDATTKNLERVTNAALATGQTMETITTVIASMEVEPLRRIGIQLDRTADTAKFAFRNIQIETAKTDKAIREGLLELFDKAFPDAIARTASNNSTATAAMQSEIEDVITNGGIPLVETLAQIKRGVTAWIQENKELLTQKVGDFTVLLAGAVMLVAHNIGILIGGMGSLIPSVQTVGKIILALNETFILAAKGALAFLEVARIGSVLSGRRQEAEETGRLMDSIATKIIKMEGESQKFANTLVQQAAMTKTAAGELFDLDAFVAKYSNGVSDAKEGTDKANEALEKMNNSLEQQIAKLQEEIATFSLDEKAKIDYTAATLMTQGASQELVAQFVSLSKTLVDLQAELKAGEELFDSFAEAMERIEERAKEIAEIKFDLLPESEQLRAKMNEQLKIVGEGTAEAQALRAQLISKSEKDITAAQRSEEISRLKTSGSFFDSVKGSWLEMVDTAKNSYDFIAEFTADTFGNVRDIIAGTIDRAVRGKFSDMADFWKEALRSMWLILLQFISQVAAQKIVLNVVPNLLGGGGGGGGNILGSILGGLGAGGGGIGASVAPGVLPTALGGPDLGALALGGGGILSGIGSSFSALGSLATLNFSALGGFFATLSAALPAIGIVAAGVSLLVPLIMKLFEKKPKFNVSIGVFDQGLKEQVASVKDFIVALKDRTTAAAQDLIEISKRKVGVDTGEFRQQVLEIINTQGIQPILAIIAQFPSEIAKGLRAKLESTKIQLDAKAMLDLRAGGKDVAEEIEEWLKELPTSFQQAIRPIFVEILKATGVEAERAAALIEEQFEIFKGLSSEERVQFGQEFIAKIQAFVTAFNIVEGNFGDAITQSISNVETLADKLGVDFNDALAGTKRLLEEATKAGTVTPELVQDVIALRTEFINLRVAISQAIANLVSFIDELNSKIAALGGTTIDTSAAIKESIANLKNLAQQEGLSLEEREAILRQMAQSVDQLVAQQVAAQQAQIQAQINANNARIEGLQRESRLIQENGKKRLDQLQKELQRAQFLLDVEKQKGDLLRGPQSIENVFQRLARTQGDIDKLFAKLSTATGDEKLRIGREIQDLINQAVSISGEAFAQPSPEFRDQFRGIIAQLEKLQAMVGPTRTIEEINASIEKVNKAMEADLKGIDSKIEALRAQSTALQQQANQLTGQAAAEAKAYYTFIRGEAVKILEQRLSQLRELGIENIGSLSVMEAIGAEQVTLLRDIKNILGKAKGYQHGGIGDFGRGTLAFLHGKEAIVPLRDYTPLNPLSRGDYTPLHSGWRGDLGGGGGAPTVNVYFGEKAIWIAGNVDSNERVEEVAEAVVRKLRFDPKTRRNVRA